MKKNVVFFICWVSFFEVSANTLPPPSLKKFSEKMADRSEGHWWLDPRQKFIDLLKEKGINKITREDYIELYNNFHHISEFHGLSYIQRNYSDLLEILKDTLKEQFDPTLKKYYDRSKGSQIIHPLKPFHKILLVGVESKKKYRKEVYGVNYVRVGKHWQQNGSYKMVPYTIDLRADMLSSKDFSRLPDKYFEKVYVECVGREAYYPEFLQNARRILKDDGVLIFNVFDSLDDPYSPKNSPAYFKKNGFDYADIRQCHFPRATGFTENYETGACWHLRKNAPSSFSQRIIHKISLGIKCFLIYQLRPIAYKISNKLMTLIEKL